MKFILFNLIFIVLMTSGLNAQNNPDFYVENGTCKCPDANFGDTGTVTINGQQQTFTKRTRAQLDALIANDINDPQIALTCTSGITDMSNLFQSSQFNQNINHWDVSNVTNMRRMFQVAYSFNQPLENWDVSSVIDMYLMFENAVSFNQPINNWDVSNVTDMYGMLSGVTSFNQTLNNWEVSNVTDMSFMFTGATSFNQPLNNWDVSNVSDMDYMFLYATNFDQNISDWCVEQIPTEPTDFSFDSPLQDSFKPEWGVSCTLGVQDNTLVDVSVYPNPVQESFRLEVNDNMTLQKMKIYSIRGRLVDVIEDLSQPINVSSLKTGVYMLRIESTSGKIMNKRIIKR